MWGHDQLTRLHHIGITCLSIKTRSRRRKIGSSRGQSLRPTELPGKVQLTASISKPEFRSLVRTLAACIHP